MCDFISWIELDGQLFYLTAKELRTKRGKALRDYLGSRFAEDVKGHGAIDFYYGLNGKGYHRECTDLSSPDNLPAEIAARIKSGAFRGIGINLWLLSLPASAEYEKVMQPALAEYEKVKQAARAEYEKVKQTALAEYEKVKQAARAEYEKVKQPAWAEYEKVKQTALAEYEKVKQPALAEYEKVEQTAWAEYEKAEQPALAEYEKVKQAAFWDLFENPENRARAWK